MGIPRGRTSSASVREAVVPAADGSVHPSTAVDLSLDRLDDQGLFVERR
jgi:hypothetical protein